MEEPTDNPNETTPASAPQLSAIELRVLGVLMEKQLTTPDQYPLTLNSVVTACNQKSSRDPITHYDKGTVARALQELDNKHFARKEHGSRSEKFTQQFMNHLELGRKQQALLCVMMLRGPQTISELNTRTQRMCEFADKEELESTIDRLCDRGVPYAVKLGQQPGQRGERIGHLFGAGTSTSALPTKNHGEPNHSTASITSISHESSTVESTDVNSVQTLQQEVDSLTATVAELQSELFELKNKVQDLGDTNS